jgi:hypothetical protein
MRNKIRPKVNLNFKKNEDSIDKIMLFMIVFIPKFLVYVIIFIICFYIVPWVDLVTVKAHVDTAALFAFNFIRIAIFKSIYYMEKFMKWIEKRNKK